MFAQLQISSSGSGFFSFLAVCWTALVVLVHLAFAWAVYSHAQGKRTIFVHPLLWTAATVMGGPLVALAYWLMHASSLAPHSER